MIIQFLRRTIMLLIYLSPFAAQLSHAEVSEIRVVHQYGLSYLTLMVMEEQKLFEKHAKEMGLGDAKATYNKMGGPGNINDSLLSASAEFGAVGVPSLVTLWAKTKGSLDYKAVAALNSMPMYLNTTNPKIKTLKDFTEKDKIALPTVKVCVQAVTLQMAVAAAMGQDKFGELDRFTVSMSHPDGMTAMMSRGSEVNSHFTSPPFQYQELEDKKVHRVLNSYEVLGGKSTFTLVVASERFKEKNPKTYDAFVAGYSDAVDWINNNKKAAAEFYVRVNKTKESVENVLKQLNDPEIEFTLTPKKIMNYAEFMNKVGTIKIKPESWKDMCHTNLHALPGS